MLPQVSCELVQSMEIWVLLMPFSQTLCCFHHLPWHTLCPAGEQVHLHRETLHRDLCPLEHGSLSRLVSGLGISYLAA